MRTSQDFPYLPYHSYAELLGPKGIKVEHSEQIAGVLKEAFAADRPVVIDASTDPEEPPIPLHVTFGQVEVLTKAFAGAPKEGFPGVVEAAREFIKEFKAGE